MEEAGQQPENEPLWRTLDRTHSIRRQGILVDQVLELALMEEVADPMLLVNLLLLSF